MTDEYDAFISYSSADEKWVDTILVPRLQGAGLTVITQKLFQPGTPKFENIDGAIAHSRYTIIVLSPEWFESNYTQYEFHVARTKSARSAYTIVPILLRPCGELPIGIDALTYVDVSRGSFDELQRIVDRIPVKERAPTPTQEASNALKTAREHTIPKAMRAALDGSRAVFKESSSQIVLMAHDDRLAEESWSVADFGALLDRANIWRAYVLYENGEIRLSHEELAPVRSFFERSHDFAKHEAVFFERERRGFNTIFTAFIHDTHRGLAQGGLRLWKYDSMADLLSDGLRLSQGMTRKNALAGLHWGGGKGIIALTPSAPSVEGYKNVKFAEERQRLFEGYGRFVASLGGVYYTAEDMGMVTTDMNVLLANNRFTTCIGEERGGSGNPSAHTAWGVFKSMQAAWQHLHGTDDLKGVRVAVQGAGNVGAPLIEYLHRAGAKLIIGEYAPTIREKVRAQYPDAEVLDDHQQIFDADAEIFAPCARGNVLNPGTIARLKVQLVCGAANNQLGEPHAAELLHEKNILYVPDYICNRTGIINCADEWAGYLEEDVKLSTEQLYDVTLNLLRIARERGISPAKAADGLADAAAAELHPILGHRGPRIIQHLVSSGWAKRDAEPQP